MKPKIIILTIVVIISAIFAYEFLYGNSSAQTEITYKTLSVHYGSLSNSISSTGTIEPISTVDVGTQVSGKIEKVYVTYNDKVKKGQLLAELDKTALLSSLKDEENSLKAAQVEYDYQNKIYSRAKELFEGKFTADTDLETAKYNLDNALIKLERAKLSYKKAEDNLSYASIFSPIDGMVLSVTVEEGQTVAASLSSPTLFTIVNDLSSMEVVAAVDEADIGSVKEGQKADFTVDAYPEDSFTGSVSQIRIEPTVSSNVVTYDVIVKVSNSEGKLLPGMTASLNIYTLTKDNILTVPSKALELTPPATELPGPPPGPGPGTGINSEMTPEKNAENSDHVWIRYNGSIFPRPVTTGESDGDNIEITDGLTVGDTVIFSISAGTGQLSTNQASSGSAEKSPFMPTPPGRKN